MPDIFEDFVDIGSTIKFKEPVIELETVEIEIDTVEYVDKKIEEPTSSKARNNMWFCCFPFTFPFKR